MSVFRWLELLRIVASKMLRDSARAGEKELARFRAEADVIARLQHPNIVQIYDVGDVAGLWRGGPPDRRSFATPVDQTDARKVTRHKDG